MKIFFTKILAALLLLFCCSTAIGQTVLTITSCDTTITDPMNGMFPNNTALTIKSATGSRLAYNVEYFNQNYSAIYIYNGPSSASPLITVLGDLLIPNQLFGEQSTGDALTFQFFGVGAGGPLHFRIRIRCVETPTNYPVFQPLKSLPAGGNIKRADYDQDGDDDLLIGGKVLRNDSYFDSLYMFERKPNVINGWDKPIITSADFDNDGFKDIFVTGNSNIFGGIPVPLAAIYRNNGNGTFTLATNVNTFAGANRGGCSVVDFNNDGKPDICYTGSTEYFYNNSRIFKLYINNGNMSFTDANISLPGISGLMSASMSWADSDGDGDKDLLVNGHNGQVNITALFTVNGTVFTNQNLPLTPTSGGAISWADVNMDGKPDIVNIGVATPDNINAIVPQLLINNGSNSFTEIVTNLPKFALGSYDLADYDGDNDLDMVLDGADFQNGGGEQLAVFKNNGNGQFSRIDIPEAVGSSRVKWFDFNNDGRLDIVGPAGVFVKNMGADSFRVASFIATNRQWGGAGTAIDDFNNDGLIDIMIMGTLADVDCNSNKISTLVLGRVWRYSGVPKFTEVANVAPLNPLTIGGFTMEMYYQWGDFDSDGKLDILMTSDNVAGTASSGLVVYKNNGNNNFSVFFNSQQTPLSPQNGYFSFRYAGMFDIDNDGINELFIPPGRLFKRVNNDWVFVLQDSIIAPFQAGIYCDFGDFNNDGFTDVVISGESGTCALRNNGAGKLVNVSTPTPGYLYGIVGVGAVRQMQLADMNNDGLLDIVNSRGVFENRNGEFVYVSSNISNSLHFGVNDFNGDGFKDIIAVPFEYVWGSLPVYYNQQGSFFFNKSEAGTVGNTSGSMWNQAVESFDVDNDGDFDFVFTPSLCNTGAAVVVNEGNFTDRLIHVITPNGNEDLTVGTIKEIKWYGYQIGNNVKIEISRDSGRSWQVLAASVNSTPGGGSYNWTVNAPTATKCLVRVSDLSNALFKDQSDAFFKISLPPVPVANAGRDTIICKGKSTVIGISAVGNSVYSWSSNPAGFVSALANPVVNPEVTTSYFLTVSIGNLIARDTVKVTVSSVTINLPDSMKTCIGRTYNIGVPAQTGYAYSWTSNPTGFVSNLSNPVITPAQNTAYLLQVKDNVSGCIAHDTLYVQADSCSPRGYGVYLYPNPASTFITFDGLLLTRHWQTLDIYDMQKRLVLPSIDISNRRSFTLQLDGLYNGVYFARLINFDGGIVILKFIKK